MGGTIKEEPEFECVTLGLALSVDRGVLLAKRTAGVAVVPETAE